MPNRGGSSQVDGPEILDSLGCGEFHDVKTVYPILVSFSASYAHVGVTYRARPRGILPARNPSWAVMRLGWPYVGKVIHSTYGGSHHD